MKTTSICTAATLVAAILLGAPTAHAQSDPARVQRDQSEVMRKAERLRGLMNSLLSRYEKEGDAEKVRLLTLGLQHLEDSALLNEVAAVRNNLDAGALAEAVRKQNDVVVALEQLLAILLERPTADSLEKEMARAEELAQTAADLAKRQAELEREVDETTRGQADASERELGAELNDLARDLRREADENVRQAGVRRPTLEAALQRVRDLLDDQRRLEQRTATEQSGRSQAREQGFRLGELRAGQEQVQAAQTRRGDLEALARRADELRTAVSSGDDARTRQQRDQLQAELRSAARGADPDARTGENERVEFEALESELAAAPQPDGSSEQAADARKQLDDIARRVAETARNAAAATGERAAERQQQLADEARALADAMRNAGAPPGQPGQPAPGEATPGETPQAEPSPDATDPAADAAQRAAEAMQRAADAAKTDDSARARSEAAQAARRAAEARRAFQDANPDAASEAQRMADEAERTSRGLRAATPRRPQPSAPGEPGATDPQPTPEADAAAALESASENLRQAAEQAPRAAQSGEPDDRDAVQQSLEESRQALESARQTLERALADANEGRERPLQAAQERNRELAERAAAAEQRMADATQAGQLSEQQQSAAAEATQSAREAMQAAERALQSGAQASASNQQQRAADALDQAARELGENRPLNEEQRDALAQAAEKQKELREDIIRLAELLEERQNRRAEEALKRASQSAQDAEESLKRGDADRAQEQQQETQQQLEQAQKELERERDRYQDLRQEELLFRIAEELQQFLDAQGPVTEETSRASAELAGGARMTRPMRRNLNGLAETERELAGKLRYVREALAEEGTLVFTHVLNTNERDLEDVAVRLSGRDPDPGEFTVLLQREVEERTQQLLQALERERQRRREERQQQDQQGQQQDQQQQDQNQFGPQRERLVPIISELIMLKQMEEEMQQRTVELNRLIDAVGADGVTEVEGAMAERLAHQHNALTTIFQQLRAQLEQALGGDQQNDDGKDPQEGRGR